MISYNENQKVFHLKTHASSYVMALTETGHLSHLYYGPKIEVIDVESLRHRWPIGVGNQTMYSDQHPTFSLNLVGLECAFYGKGDYREPTVHAEDARGFRTIDPVYQNHRTVANLHYPNMPQATKKETLQILLEDTHLKLQFKLNYTVYDEEDTIVRNLEILNGPHGDLILDKALSMNLDFEHDQFDVLTLDGAWLRERQIHESPLRPGIFKIDSKKGTSSNDHNPFVALKESHAHDHHGLVYGFNLIYSGNFEANIEVSPHALTRINMGINGFDFKWRLEPHETFVTPEVILTVSSHGLQGMQKNMHAFASRHLLKHAQARPIVYNTWEALYFDVYERRLTALAHKAKHLGCEIFCVDDGWFGQRDDDHSSLGDWTPHRKKFKKGIAHFANKVRKLGLGFGLWVEPEMVSPKSELFQKHPEWLLHYPERDIALGRHQYVLDLTLQAVQDYLFNQLDTLFNETQVAYVKWDMNRHFSDLYSAQSTRDDQGKLAHRYVLGLYALLTRLTQAHPQVLFESCSSGGNRFDYGMHYFMPQAWTSDNTDAYERLSIQRGTLLAYPPSVISNHINADISHQVLRSIPLETRFNVAAYGILGVECNLKYLTPLDRKTLKAQLAFYKEHRELFQYGQHTMQQQQGATLLSVINDDQTHSIVTLVQGLNQPNPATQRLKIRGLKPDEPYRLSARPQGENLRRFGQLIAHALPLKLNANGGLFAFLANRFALKTEQEDTVFTGSQAEHSGIALKPPFSGSGYHSELRIMPDFASRMYLVKKENSDGE